MIYLQDTGLTGLVLIGLSRDMMNKDMMVTVPCTATIFNAMGESFPHWQVAHEYLGGVRRHRVVNENLLTVLLWPLDPNDCFSYTESALLVSDTALRVLPSGVVVDRFKGTDEERAQLAARIRGEKD